MADLGGFMRTSAPTLSAATIRQGNPGTAIRRQQESGVPEDTPLTRTTTSGQAGMPLKLN